MNAQYQDKLAGVLLGTAVGDALGLPFENLSARRARRLWEGDLRMRLLFGRGMFSDDTEHTLMVAQALLSHGEDAAAFQRALAWKLRWWLVSLPGGVGLATARACLRLWLGFPASKSGVVSAGSGPAMRSAILGAFFADDPKQRQVFVEASTKLTHRGWQAEAAATAVAEAAARAVNCGRTPEAAPLFTNLRTHCAQREWQNWISLAETALERQETVAGFAHTLSLEAALTGYSLQVVPIALYAWLRHRADFREAVTAAIACGGDTDTVAAIVGGLCGATVGSRNIPTEWINRLAEWPRSVAFMRKLAEQLAEQQNSGRALGEVHYFWPGLLPRNVLFLAVILLHGFRRLLPPY